MHREQPWRDDPRATLQNAAGRWSAWVVYEASDPIAAVYAGRAWAAARDR